MDKTQSELSSRRIRVSKNTIPVKKKDPSRSKSKIQKRGTSKRNLIEGTEYLATIKCSHGFYHPIRKGTDVADLLKSPLESDLIENTHIEWSLAKNLLQIQRNTFPCDIPCCDNANQHKAMRHVEVSEEKLTSITYQINGIMSEMHTMLEVMSIQSDMLGGIILMIESLNRQNKTEPFDPTEFESDWENIFCSS